MAERLHERLLGKYKILAASDNAKHLKVCTLSKLKNHQSCLTHLLTILQRNNQYHIDDFFDETKSGIKVLWNSIAGNALYCMASHLSSEMKKIIRSKAVLDSYMASIVCPRLILTILDSESFDPSLRVTVFQFKLFFEGHNNPDHVICEFAADRFLLKFDNQEEKFLHGLISGRNIKK